MDNNKLVAGGLIAIGAYFLAKQTGLITTEKTYIVPGVGPVRESQLPAYGFVNVQGLWISQAVMQTVYQQQGSPGGSGWLNWLINNGESAYNTIADLVSQFGGLLGNNNYELEGGFILGDPDGPDPFDIG